MAKPKRVKTWKIQEKFLKQNGGVNGILLEAVGGDLGIFSNINQAVGAICNAGLEHQLQTLFEAYATYGIWLSENQAIDINFKIKEGVKKFPEYC